MSMSARLAAGWRNSRCGAILAAVTECDGLHDFVWGSDRPNPTEKANSKPDDAILFDLLADWAPDEAIRNRILVDNPAALDGFG
jgi:predicted TIM-barrel fold metal-dependent hydrolase